MQIIPILPIEYSRDLELVTVHVVQIDNPRLVPKIIAYLDQNHPVPKNLSHLKRIKKISNQILQILVGHQSQESILVDDVMMETTTVQVPKHPAVCTSQYSEWKVHWPLFFTVSKDIKYLIANFSDFNLKNDELIMVKEHLEFLLKQTSSSESMTLVVNENNSRVALGIDNRKNHPIHHSAIAAITKAAENRSETDYLLTGCTVFLTREPCVMYL